MTDITLAVVLPLLGAFVLPLTARGGLAWLGSLLGPALLVLNKIDAIKDISQLEMIETVFPEAVAISAKSGLGLDALSRKVAEYYRGGEIVLRVPDQG
mgnify:CR=1 FL=1